jgi:hypothetical protein
MDRMASLERRATMVRDALAIGLPLSSRPASSASSRVECELALLESASRAPHRFIDARARTR